MDCLQLVLDLLDRIENLVQDFSREFGVNIRQVWLWKGRARGKCDEDSDIDIWIEISEDHRVEILNKMLLVNPLPWEYHNGKRVVWDFKFGVGTPLRPKISLDTLRKLRAKHSSE